ncbi:hypothetical protein [uncultured Paraglaciecola sp.]|uniref:hypothetical protein n=1 Tax=uncultured Paraglaciecola sp. TaxID=1765024 RepID=UPI00263671BD|nr:hypothetical protein [uncultured Paraglaciecola sp.]
MGAVLVVDGRGQLNWTPRARPTDESADVGSIVLDPSNCVTSNELTLKHIKTDIHPSVKISYDYDSIETQTFLQPVTYRDIESESHNKIVPGKKVKEFAFKGLHSGVHTGTQLLKLAATYGDDYFYEKQSFTIESYVNDIQLGTLVAVDFPDVVDDATGAANSGPLKRTMLVVESRENRETRTTTYTLSGSLYIQSTRQSSQKLHNLEIAEYKRGKINIATLSGISVSDGIATGSITLVMGRDYYYVNDASPGEGLELSENLSVLVVGTGPYIGFHVFGPFVIKCPIDLTGKSKQLPGAGGTQNTPASRGGEGYALTSRSSSSYDTRQVYSTYLSSNETIYSKAGLQISGGSRGNVTSGLYPRAPDPLLDVNDGILGGLPPDLSGTSGSGGPVSKFTDPDRRPQTPSGSTSRNPSVQYINGSTGGRGGGGIIIVSWGGSIEGNGVVVLNGASPSTVNSITVGNKTLSGSRGGPGMPGSFLWVVDGNHAFPTLTETNVQAFPGDATIAGEKIQQFGSVISDAGSYRPALDATPRTNLFQSVTRIAFTPDAEIVQDRQLNVLGVFLKNQRDGRVRIHVGSADPSNADYGDMRITQTALDSNAADVDFRILTSSGWRDFVRGVDDFEYVYDALIAGKRKYNSLEIVASNTRPVGEPDGTIWYNPSNGTEWILYENQDDILIRENQVPQGEDLINDLSFARSLAGEKLWLFTRNENLAPNNTKSATATSGGSSGGGGSTSTQGITLTDQGRTVAGTAYQDDGGGIIVQGRQGTVTLDDTTQLTFTVGASGAFSVTFPSTNDNNLGKQASIYTQNAAAGTQAQLNFTYEL